MRLSLKIALLCLGLLAGKAPAQEDPFVGRFSGEIDGKVHELLIFSDSPGSYDGELRADGKRVPMIGRRFGEHMMGKIGFPDDAFAFRARSVGAILLLERKDQPPLRFFRESD